MIIRNGSLRDGAKDSVEDSSSSSHQCHEVAGDAQHRTQDRCMVEKVTAARQA